MSDAQMVVVLVTASGDDEARRIGRELVEERLAACVNVVGPVTSIFRWDGRVQEEAERLLVVKARRADVERLAARVRALHSYEVPEVLAVEAAEPAPPPAAVPFTNPQGEGDDVPEAEPAPPPAEGPAPPAPPAAEERPDLP